MKFIPDPKIQFGTAGQIRAFQEERLAETVEYLACNSDFYRRMFADKGIDPHSIRKTEDLLSLPLTSKDDLQRYSEDFICVPKI